MIIIIIARQTRFFCYRIIQFWAIIGKNVYDNANKEMHKIWLILYTCALTRSIIFDLIPSLSANSLKNCLKSDVSPSKKLVLSAAIEGL